MNSDDVVLVALVNRARDWELIAREQWYRIPTRYAPKHFAGAQYLAFYFSRAFGEQKWQISQYAAVRGHELARRRDLIPDEPDHPRADALYYKLQLGALETREPPIVSKRGRRILFLWTTWEKFSNARQVNDLFHKGAAHDRLWNALGDANLDVEREMMVREGASRYRVDYLIFCARGRVAVSIGNQKRHFGSRTLRGLEISQDELDNHLERALAKIHARVREMGGGYQEKMLGE